MAANNSFNSTIVSGDFTLSSGNLQLPATSSTAGSVRISTGVFMHAYGTTSAYLGVGSGNLTNSGTSNVGCGPNALHSVSSGSYNVAVGDGALYTCSSSSNNTAIGYRSLYSLSTSSNGGNVAMGDQTLYSITTGAYNIAIGTQAGNSCVTSNSNNIYIANTGANESNTIRIGATGAHTKCFIAGIYNYSGTLGATNCGVLIDSNFQMQTTLSNSSDTVARTLNMMKIRGTGAITAGDDLGTLSFSGYTGAAYAAATKILGKNKTGSTVSNMAGQLIMYTKPDSGTAITARLTIDSTGEVTIAAPDSGVGLTISGGGETVTGTIQGDTLRTSTAATYLSLNAATITGTGSDTDVSITLTPKGTGVVSTAANINAAGISFDSGTTTMANYSTTTWTPVLNFGGATTGITYGTQTGTYWRVGNIIFYTCDIVLTSNGSATGAATITGLPVTVSSDSFGTAILGVATFANGVMTSGMAKNGQTYLELYYASNAGGAITALTDAETADTTSIKCSGFYFV